MHTKINIWIFNGLILHVLLPSQWTGKHHPLFPEHKHKRGVYPAIQLILQPPQLQNIKQQLEFFHHKNNSKVFTLEIAISSSNQSYNLISRIKATVY